MLNGKHIVLGVGGGIACYKLCDVVSRLKKLNAEIDVIMTRSATAFVAPLTFETLSKNRVAVEMFDGDFHDEVAHISLAKKADLFVVAPATANLLGKFAGGIADDMLSTTFLATRAQVLLCPSMNVNMYESAAVQQNLKTLAGRGCRIFEPTRGLLACGDVGKGKLPDPERIVEEICKLLLPKQDFAGLNVLVTAGGTREHIDPVRVLANLSSGKMGVELARAARERGASVTLIAGSVSVPVPPGVEVVNVETTQEMYEVVLSRLERADVVVKAAAPADYRLKEPLSQKSKADTLKLELVKNPDIAKAVGERKGNRTLVVFSAETEHLLENAKKKLLAKNADLVVANDVTQEGAGFHTDTNIATLIDRNGGVFPCEKMPKSTLSHIILDKVAELCGGIK